jgi:hypothetical protein
VAKLSGRNENCDQIGVANLSVKVIKYFNKTRLQAVLQFFWKFADYLPINYKTLQIFFAICELAGVLNSWFQPSSLFQPSNVE